MNLINISSNNLSEKANLLNRDQFSKKEVAPLIEKANDIFLKNFSDDCSFERALFFSWTCGIGDCKFCYMSTQPKEKALREARRSKESIFAESILCKVFGWPIGFFTGGIGAFTVDELLMLIKGVNEIVGYKIWLSIGPVSKKILEKFSPYICGVVGSTETVNPILHREVCPSKPLEPYEKMFLAAKELELERAMTFIVGLGEKKSDFELLKEFIDRYGISKIHLYGLIPQKGTEYEKMSPPSSIEQAWWIAKLRTAFPKLDIQCGIWADRIERVPVLLNAGANSISKFPATRLFASKKARDLESECGKANRNFNGTLSDFSLLDIDKELNKLSFDDELKGKIKVKLLEYKKKMMKNFEQAAQL